MNMKENELHVETQNKRYTTDISKFTIGCIYYVLFQVLEMLRG